MIEKNIAVLYHGGCPDGFAGAYAAWKKFGDSADYIPATHGLHIPEGLAGKQIFLIDFAYPQELMDELRRVASSVIVLDHHLGMREVVESVPDHVFDDKHSGAILAWEYFHPDIPVPVLFAYIEDGDRYLFNLPESRAALAYAYAQKFTFESWDELVKEFENDETRAILIEKGKIYSEHFTILVEQISKKAILVSFEGYECYLVGAANMFTSDVGNYLARLKPPVGIVVNLHGNIVNVSLRSTPEVDVSLIAQKYGGNGHPQASGFHLSWGDTLPWKAIEPHESPRD